MALGKPIFTWLLFAAAGTVFLTGTVLMFRARGGRRLDDRRVCAKCRYDLHGTPADASSCPECGAAFGQKHATYTGNRVLHGRLVSAGLLTFFFGLVGASFLGLTARRGYNWNRHAPMSLLIHEAFDSNGQRRSRSAACDAPARSAGEILSIRWYR